MSSIDQGLDEIISSKGGISNATRSKPKRNANKKSAAAKAGVGKASNAARKSRAQRESSAARAAASLVNAAAANPLALAKRVVVNGLPLDVDENAVREYFSSSVGRIRNIKGVYNSRGVSTGSFNITFEKNGSAQRLMEKFHNQPIDGGKSRLTVQILVDATAVPTKSLAERIGSGSGSGSRPLSAVIAAAKQTKQKKSAKLPVKAAPKKQAQKQQKQQKQKQQKQKPKTAEELDAEMNDYFANASSNEISV